MGNLIRGTTPTITYNFKTVQVANMAVAYLTIVQLDQVIEYDLTQADVDVVNNSLTWTLTQEDTLKLRAMSSQVKIQCRWRLLDGMAGASEITSVSGDMILKDGVI